MKVKYEEDKTIHGVEVKIRAPMLDDEVLEIIASLKAKDKKIIGIKDNSSTILELSDIYYFDSVDKKTFTYCKNEVYETSLKLYELEESLAAFGFVRTSKQQVLNLDKVESIQPESSSRLRLKLENGEIVVVSRQYAPIIKAKLFQQ